MSSPFNIALIYGSTRQGRLCDSVGQWVLRQLGRHPDLPVDVIDPALFLPASAELRGYADGQASQALSQRVAQADAIIVVTPEYNHSFPAPLKFVIDSMTTPWYAKPVAFVSYGGLSGGLRAVEQLRLVFAELHAVTLRNTVSFMNAWDQFDADGHVVDEERAQAAFNVMLRDLRWWAGVLRDARQEHPYRKEAA